MIKNINEKKPKKINRKKKCKEYYIYKLYYLKFKNP